MCVCVCDSRPWMTSLMDSTSNASVAAATDTPLKGEPQPTTEPLLRNPLSEMMAHPSRAARSNDPWMTCVLYCVRLLHIAMSEPLYGIKYYGQAVRAGSAEDVAKARWKEEVNQASREHKQVGFLAALELYGESAFEWTIVEQREGTRTEMQAYADAGEKRLIAEAGGPLRDMDKRLHQTLNQTEGGSGNARWTGIDALRKKAFMRFKAEMEAYVDEFKTSLVENLYVNPLTGYKLSSQLNQFRKGIMRDGSPDREAIEAWAESLPKWAWKPRETEEYREGLAERTQERMDNETAEAKAERIAKLKVTKNKPENIAAQSKRMCEQLDNETDEAKAKRLSKQKKTKNARTDATLVGLKGKALESRKKAIAKQRRGDVKLAAGLKLYQASNPGATRADMFAAKREGLRKNAKTKKTLDLLIIEVFESSKKRKKAIAYQRHANATRAADLLLYRRTVKHDANQADMRLAKREGWKAPTTVV